MKLLLGQTLIQHRVGEPSFAEEQTESGAALNFSAPGPGFAHMASLERSVTYPTAKAGASGAVEHEQPHCSRPRAGPARFLLHGTEHYMPAQRSSQWQTAHPIPCAGRGAKRACAVYLVRHRPLIPGSVSSSPRSYPRSGTRYRLVASTESDTATLEGRRFLGQPWGGVGCVLGFSVRRTRHSLASKVFDWEAYLFESGMNPKPVR